MNYPEAPLSNRKLGLLTLLYLAATSWIWISVFRATSHRVDKTVALFAFVLLVAFARLAYRSSFWADRVVLGAIAISCALITVRALSLTPALAGGLSVAGACLWTIASIASAAALVINLKASRMRARTSA